MSSRIIFSRLFFLGAAGALLSAPPQAQVTYTGKVTDRAKAPLADATVRVVGSGLAAQTAADGSFTLSGAVTGLLPAPHPLSAARAGTPYLANGRRHRDLSATVFHALLGGPAPSSAASAASAAKTAAPNTLAAAKSGYVTGSFRQFSDNAKNLSLSLYANPVPADYAAGRKACLDTVNALRKLVGLAPVAESAALVAFADSGAHYDSDRGAAHGHFGTQGRTLVADAENELPGWDYGGSLAAIVQAGTQMMWAEGPGGGHYENIKGNHAFMGCGFYVNAAGEVWVVQDFR
jgi:uncharacterized protein YkwD